MYEILFTELAAKQFRKLESPVQDRIRAVLERTRIRPESFFVRLIGVDAYKIRIGDWRIIADLQQDRLIILVLKVGHRRSVYES